MDCFNCASPTAAGRDPRLAEEKPRLPKKTGPEADSVRPLKSPVSPSAPTRNVAFGSAPCLICALGLSFLPLCIGRYRTGGKLLRWSVGHHARPARPRGDKPRPVAHHQADRGAWMIPLTRTVGVSTD